MFLLYYLHWGTLIKLLFHTCHLQRESMKQTCNNQKTINILISAGKWHILAAVWFLEWSCHKRAVSFFWVSTALLIYLNAYLLKNQSNLVIAREYQGITYRWHWNCSYSKVNNAPVEICAMSWTLNQKKMLKMGRNVLLLSEVGRGVEPARGCWFKVSLCPCPQRCSTALSV